MFAESHGYMYTYEHHNELSFNLYDLGEEINLKYPFFVQLITYT